MRCESAPPQSGDRPDGSLLGWDGTLVETGGFPDKRTLEIRFMRRFSWETLKRTQISPNSH